MGLLFVPLTTITNGPIPKEQMGNATSLFNLMRNMGASIGIASVTTIVARHSQEHTNMLAGHITPYDPAATALMNSLKTGLIASGVDAATAGHRAFAMAFGMVERHAAILAYLDTFLRLSGMFVLALPLIFIMKKPKGGGGGGPEGMGH